jgi:hypothetical protein
MDHFHAAGLRLMGESYQKYIGEIEAVEAWALAAYRRKQYGDLIGMCYHMRHARELLKYFHLDPDELMNETAIYMMTFYSPKR